MTFQDCEVCIKLIKVPYSMKNPSPTIPKLNDQSLTSFTNTCIYHFFSNRFSFNNHFIIGKGEKS